jgi:hypothetical protein
MASIHVAGAAIGYEIMAAQALNAVVSPCLR